MSVGRMAGALVLVAALAAGVGTASAAGYKIGFVDSLSGPDSSLGIPYQKGLKAGYAFQHTVHGEPVQVVTIDDTSDPTQAQLAVRKLVTQDHVDAIIGSANSANDTAMMAVAQELKVPMVALAPIRPTGPNTDWAITVVQPVPLMVSTVMKRLKRDGIKTIGMIAFSDTSGDLFTAEGKKAAAEEGIKVVAEERYATNATSVTGQIAKILQHHPQAIINYGSAGPGALPMLALAQLGYKGPVFGDPSLLSKSFVDLAGAAGNGVIISAGPVAVADQLPHNNPIRAVALKFDHIYAEVNHAPPADAFSSYAYDGWLLLMNAMDRVPKDVASGTPEYRAKLRDALYSVRDLVGTQAVYNFHPGNTYGVDQRSMVLVKLENGKWHYVP